MTKRTKKKEAIEVKADYVVEETVKDTTNEHQVLVSDLINLDPDKKSAFVDRMVNQLLEAEKSVEIGRTKDDIKIVEKYDFAEYDYPLTLTDEAEYIVYKYKIHPDVATQINSHIDSLVRFDEISKLDILLQSGDIEEKDIKTLLNQILYTPNSVQGLLNKYIKGA